MNIRQLMALLKGQTLPNPHGVTHQRVREAYKACNRVERKRMVDLSSYHAQYYTLSIYRNTVGLSGMVCIAYVCNLSPLWLCGYMDVKKPFSKEALLEVLKEYPEQIQNMVRRTDFKPKEDLYDRAYPQF